MQELEYKAMGERIRRRREELNISREKLAEMLDITTKFCSDIEIGYRGVSLKTLVRISECLMLSVDYILFGNTSPINEQTFLRLICKCPNNKKEYLLEIIQKIIDSYGE